MSLFSDHVPDPWDYENDEPSLRSPPRCVLCDEQCTWHHTGVRWALMGANGRLHDCRAAPAAASDFPDLSDDFSDMA